MNRYTWTGNDKPEGRLYLGDLKADKNGDLHEIPCTLHGDYVGNTVEASNTNYILSLEVAGVFEVFGGYGTRFVVATAEALKTEEIAEVLEQLETYIVLDEDGLLELEYRLEEETWDSYVKYDLFHALTASEIEFDPDQARDIFYNLIYNGEVEFVHDDCNSPYVDINKVVECWPAA